MRTIKSKVAHVTDDGRKFKDKEAALKHESLFAARDRYQSARSEYGRLLAETFTTADGYPFNLSSWRYWYIHKPYNAMPRLIEVWTSCRNWDVVPEEYAEKDSMKIYVPVDAFGNKADASYGYLFSELWYYKDKAEAALREACIEWLDQQRQYLDENKL